MYFKEALLPNSMRLLHERVSSYDKIEVGEADACVLSLNGIGIGRMLILSSCGVELRQRPADRGYPVRVTPLSSFQLRGARHAA